MIYKWGGDFMGVIFSGGGDFHFHRGGGQFSCGQISEGKFSQGGGGGAFIGGNFLEGWEIFQEAILEII